MCGNGWDHAWDVLFAASYCLGEKAPKKLRRRVKKLLRDVGVALPCTRCRDTWKMTMPKSRADRRNLWRCTASANLWFTFVFDFRVAWTMCNSTLKAADWQKTIERFSIRPTDRGTRLVMLRPKLFSPDTVVAASLGGCDDDAGFCPPKEPCVHRTLRAAPALGSSHITIGVKVCPICSSLSWGKYFWRYFHTVSLSTHLYETDKQRGWLWKHIQQVAAVVPCGECYMHWKHAIGQIERHKLPAHIMESPINCFTFLFQLHNVWNSKLNKPIGEYPWEKAVVDYGLDPATTFLKNRWNPASADQLPNNQDGVIDWTTKRGDMGPE